MLTVLDIEADVRLGPPAKTWRLPLRPGAAFLFALRAFLETCCGAGRQKPVVLISGQEVVVGGLKRFEGRLVLQFAQQCNLITRFNAETERNQHPPDGETSDTCRAFYNLLSARIELPEELQNTGLWTYGVDRRVLGYHPKEHDSNQITLTWEVPNLPDRASSKETGVTERVRAFDHADTILRQTLGTCGFSLVANIDDVVGATMAICHHPDDAKWAELIKASKPGSIFVRTSSVGRAGHPHYMDNGVIVLELQPSHDPERGGVTADQWKDIVFEVLKDGVAARITHGDMPSWLTAYFCVVTKQASFLPALSILCQGYLAVHCGPDGRGGLVVEAEDAAKKVAAALQAMGWEKVLASDEIRRNLALELTEPESSARKPLREKVSVPSFWNVFGEEAPEKLAAVAAAEWQNLSGVGAFDKSCVAALVRSMLSPRSDKDFPGLVAGAYLELAKGLGGTSGS
jgi:hypothetical protein